MYLKTSEFEFLKKMFIPLNKSPASNEDILEYYKIMKRLMDEQKETNKRAAEYIADKRKTNRNYGRSEAEKRAHEEAQKRKESKRKDGANK